MLSSGSAQMGSPHLDVLQGATLSDGGSWTYDFIPPEVGDEGQSWLYQEVDLGLDRIIALYDRSSASHQIHEDNYSVPLF